MGGKLSNWFCKMFQAAKDICMCRYMITISKCTCSMMMVSPRRIFLKNNEMKINGYETVCNAKSHTLSTSEKS